MKAQRFIISGGGTGGHIFPAIAIADALKNRIPSAKILFVGAEGKMEMEKVPQAGYEIKGLKVIGLQRSLTWKNVLFPFKLAGSLLEARNIVKTFMPDVVVGVGGYASAPTLAMAGFMGIPTVIQEQNSYAGLTNKWLSKRVKRICVAYEGMNKFFDAGKIVLTGNPVRKNLLEKVVRQEALDYFKLAGTKKTILIFGGSLGAKTINEAMARNTEKIADAKDIQFIWQIGSFYEKKYMQCETALLANVFPMVFINRMDFAYAVADLVICRAGALTISELCALGKASILVPSPNVAEDHQTANANALVLKHAAEMVKDMDVDNVLINKTLALIHDQGKLKDLEDNSLALGKPDATERIVDTILELTK